MRILRLLASRPLPCGCLVGIYETYTGPIEWILEARGDACGDPTHQPGQLLRGNAESGTRPAERTPDADSR